MNRRFSTLDGNPMNRRFSTLDGTPSSQDPENVPSHRCLILDQSFEALKSARSSTEAMKKVQGELVQTVQTEGEKNKLYENEASEFAQFSEQNEESFKAIDSRTMTAKPNESTEGSKETENSNCTQSV